jgi:RNA polymerase sigma factor (sigma-70 family)
MTEQEFRGKLVAYLETKTPLGQAVMMTRSLPAGEELVQAAAVRALEKWQSYDDKYHVGQWFYFMMLNIQRGAWAKDKKTLSLDAPLGVGDDSDGLTHADLLVSDVPLLEAVALADEEAAAFSERTRVALASLRAQHRMALVARDLRGLDWPDAAAAASCTLEQVRSVVSTARNNFKTYYAALEPA